MSRPVKYIAILIVLAVLAAAVTGVAYWAASSDPDAPNPGLYLDDKKVENPAPVMTVGEYEVPFDVFRHYLLVYKSYFESYYGATFFDSDPDGDKMYVLQNSVETELYDVYIWLAIAEEFGYELDEADLADIQETLDNQKALYGDAFEKHLIEDMFFTSEENYIEITKLQKLVEKAEEEWRAMIRADNVARISAEADAEYAANHISAKHILAAVDEEAADQEAEFAAAEERAAAWLQQIQESEDPAATFDELMLEYTEDPGIEQSPDGYTFTEGEFVQEFYDAAMALEEGEISGLVRSDFGYHIIMRIPLLQADVDSNRETAINIFMGTTYSEKVTAMKEAMPVVYSDYYYDLRVPDIR